MGTLGNLTWWCVWLLCVQCDGTLLWDDKELWVTTRFTWEPHSVTLESDSPASLTKHGFNGLSSNAVKGKA